MNIHAFPRCAAYLKAMHVRLDDPAMTDYWFAVILADAFTDEDLTAAGTVNFDTMKGDELLGAFDKLLADRRKQRTSIPPQDMESLKAFFGSRGVKVSAFKSDEDYWKAAAILWPHVVKRKDHGSLSELHGRIRSISKKLRQSAGKNITRLPAEWRAR